MDHQLKMDNQFFVIGRGRAALVARSRAFSSEVDTGSREENASK